MGTDVIIRDNDTVPEKKTKMPGKWQVVLHYGSPHHIPCCTCLLTTVFNKTTLAAAGIMRQAQKSGKASVLVSGYDVVQTKTAEAEESRINRSSACTPEMSRVKFMAEPL